MTDDEPRLNNHECVADSRHPSNPRALTPGNATRNFSNLDQARNPLTMATNNNNAAENADPPPEAPEAEAQPGEDTAEEAPPAIQEARMPTKKDTSLREFLGKMDDYAPIVCSLPLLLPPPFDRKPLSRADANQRHQIPDAVTHYYMTKAGLPPPPQTDPRLARLLALATQKFIADVSADAYQYSRIRASNTNANNPMGNLGAAAGFPIPGQPAGGAAPKDQGKGGSLLGIQRAGYGGGGSGGSANKTILSIEDLGMALGEYGVNVKRSEFYR